SGSRSALTALPEWRLFRRAFYIVFNPRAFLIDKVADGAPQTRMRDPVRGIRRLRQIPTLNFMPSLGARLDAFQAVRDSPVDGAIIAEFEVQEGPVADAAPVPPEQRLGPREVQRARDRLSIMFSIHQHDTVAEPLTQQGKELPGQISRTPFAIDR